eukprot:TRINITY_DN1502_c1_g1_i4.p1 TRINITY_DN1502_c1_g1~~TRINITY_DN1502_c1_g1_i4.p1  ORF type:complete len:596 (+),score=185.86 TRINITY_DN1502_c1_g1_i4:216-2003(+)
MTYCMVCLHSHRLRDDGYILMDDEIVYDGHESEFVLVVKEIDKETEGVLRKRREKKANSPAVVNIYAPLYRHSLQFAVKRTTTVDGCIEALRQKFSVEVASTLGHTSPRTLLSSDLKSFRVYESRPGYARRLLPGDELLVRMPNPFFSHFPLEFDCVSQGDEAQITYTVYCKGASPSKHTLPPSEPVLKLANHAFRMYTNEIADSDDGPYCWLRWLAEEPRKSKSNNMRSLFRRKKDKSSTRGTEALGGWCKPSAVVGDHSARLFECVPLTPVASDLVEPEMDCVVRLMPSAQYERVALARRARARVSEKIARSCVEVCLALREHHEAIGEEMERELISVFEAEAEARSSAGASNQIARSVSDGDEMLPAERAAALRQKMLRRMELSSDIVLNSPESAAYLEVSAGSDGGPVAAAPTASDDSEYTPLHLAALSGDHEMIEMLLQDRRYVTARTIDGTTPLHYFAVSYGAGNPKHQRRVLHSMLHKGAELNATTYAGETPLHRTIMKKNIPAMKELLDLGADHTIKLKNGMGCVDMAIAMKCPEALALLLEAGAGIGEAHIRAYRDGKLHSKLLPVVAQHVDRDSDPEPIEQDSAL